MTREMKSAAGRQLEGLEIEGSALFQVRGATWKMGVAELAIRRACRLSLAVLVLGFMCVLPAELTAQSAVFMGTRQTIGTFQNPAGVAIDRSGNLYVADSGGAASSIDEPGCVYKFPAGGGAPSVVGTGLMYAQGVAVDAAGDLFIADPSGGQLVEVSAVGGAQETIVDPSQSYAPLAVAIDPSGPVVFVDRNTWKVWKIIRTTGDSPSRYEAVGTGLVYPTGVAVDSAGNVFISDPGLDQVIEVPADGTPQFSIATGLVSPSGVAIDSVGNVFITDTGNVNNNRVIEVPARGSGGAQITVLTGLQNPTAVAVDDGGNLFVANAYVGAVANTGVVVELQTRSINFGSVSACSAAQFTPALCSQTLSAPITVFSGGNGTAKALTMGAYDQDFAVTGTTCGTRHQCTYTVTFTPRRPGLRSGALQITNGAGGPVILTVPLYGVGLAPLLAFNSAGQTQTKIAVSGLKNPTAVASDGSGNVYIADADNDRVVKMPANGGAQSTVGTGLANPLGVAVDGAGNVFIADWGNKRVVKVSPQGVQTTVDTGFIGAAGVAVDKVGNVFVSDYPNNRVVEVQANGGALTTMGEGLMGPRGIAVDALGQVFIASGDNGLVVEILLDGSQISVGTGLTSPYGVALDAAGDVFIADYGASEVVEVPKGGAPQFTVGSGFTNPDGISVDGLGNMVVADSGNGRVLKLPLASAPKLSFAKTAPGTSGGPKTVLMQNIGNAYLALTSVSTLADFNEILDVGKLLPGNNFLPGQTTTLNVNFTPTQDEQLNENITITDNSLNQPGATQSIAVSGTAVGPGVSLSADNLPFGTVLVGSTSGTLLATLTNSGNSPLVISRVEITGDTNSFVIANNCGKSLAAAASCTISGQLVPKGTGYLAATLTIYDNALNSSQSVLLSGAGAEYPIVSFSVTGLVFPDTGVGRSSASQQVVLTNTGNEPLSISSINVVGSMRAISITSVFVFTNDCGTTLAAGAQCEISGYFAPGGLGTIDGSILIVDSLGEQSIALSGTGVALKLPVR
jgi:sugar lactone lactonase YvrE